MRRREFIAALLIVLIVSFGFWYYQHVAFEPPLTKNVDLSELFKSGPNETMGPGDFLELPDPARTKSFSLELTRPVSERSESHTFDQRRSRSRTPARHPW